MLFTFLRSQALRAAWFLAWLLPAALPVLAQPVPVTDVFPVKGYARTPVALNGSLYFAARTDATGTELWKSTLAGTHFQLVKDVVPGAGSSNPPDLILVNTTLYFTAGNGLYKSDGTGPGTALVKTFAAPPGRLTHVNGTVYFAATDGTRGVELWKSNGTAAGTVLVKDINPNAGHASPSSLAALNGTLYFAADDGTNGVELWKSNGTAAGTTLVRDIAEGSPSSSPSGMTPYDGRLYFAAGGYKGVELWSSDGTAAGTYLTMDILSDGEGAEPPYYSSYPQRFMVAGGNLYFVASVFPDGIYRVFTITAGGSIQEVGGAEVLRYGVGASITDMIDINGTVYYGTGSSGSESEGFLIRLYKLEGTTNTLVKDFSMGGEWVHQFTQVNGVLYFRAGAQNYGPEIWRSDGTPGGTVQLPETVVGPGSSEPSLPFGLGNALYFTSSASPGQWKYDLTQPQATAIRLNAGGPAHSVEEYPSYYYDKLPTDYFGADAYFTGGTAASREVYLENESDPVLYQTERRGEFSYAVPVPRGKYRVILHFAEVYWGNLAAGGAGSRQFHVNMEGGRRFTNYDIYARAGGALKSVRDTVELDVLDGTLNIQFLRGAADQPKVNALEILPITPINFPPVLAGIGNKGLTLGQSLSFKASATDAEGNPLSFSLVGAPAGATIHPATGAFAWTPSGPGTYPLTVRVTDNNAYTPGSDEEKITVTVNAAVAGTYRVNAGGNPYATPDARSFSGDAYFSGGVVSGTTPKDIAGTGDDYLYQTGRHGTSFSYNFPTGNGSYDVVLHFAETYFGNTAPGGIGSRKFHVNLEGARKLTDYDVFARAGGALRVAQETFRVTVSDGTLNVAFLKGSADNPAVKAIEVLPAGSALSINAGGAAFTGNTGKKFSADVYYASGTVSSIAGGEITNTTDDALYRNARVGVFSYGLPSGNGTFNVTLHFAETYFGSRVTGGAGSRKFNVYVEGAKRLSDYDVFAKAGGALRAVKETVQVTVTDGILNLYFAKGTADNPLISAIEVTPAATAAREAAPEAGNAQVRLFPNPVQDRLFVTLPFPAARVQGTAVTDARGRVLLPDGHRISGENGLEIGTESLPRGLFLLRIHAGDQTQTLKFLKQ